MANLPHVLVVEDDSELRESFCDVLQQEGFTVDAVGNGADALGWLLSRPPPSLILLDLMMPVMSGAELQERLQEHEGLKSIPLVVLSALDVRRQRNTLPGARAYLKKPIDVQALVGTITSVAGGSSP